MKKTLVFKSPSPYNRTLVWDVSSKWLRERAYVDLFRILDSELDIFSKQDAVTCALITIARAGNPEACEALLCYTRNKSHQGFEEVEVRLPTFETPVLLDPVDRIEVKVDCPEAMQLNGTVGQLPMPWPEDGKYLKRPTAEKAEK